MKQLILILCAIILMGCCISEDVPLQSQSQTENSSPPIIYGQMYRIQVPIFGASPRVVTFTIDDHEYIGSYNGSDGNINHFIHSPNCKCHKESCTSSDLLSQPSWY